LPQLCQKLDVLGPVYVAEVRLAPLARALRALGHRPLPRFPGTRRDIAVVARRDVPAETLRGFLAAHAGGKLGPSVVEQVRLFDVYTGKPIPETHVSLAFAIEYRSHERTLTDTEVGEAFAQVQDELKRHFEVEVRSAS
jgi:phenylalanyl-tRNA synthetase beta chain